MALALQAVPFLVSMLFAAERHAVRALLHLRICLVGPDLDAVKGAIVFIGAVVHTLLDGTGDAFVLFAVHGRFSSKKFFGV